MSGVRPTGVAVRAPWPAFMAADDRACRDKPTRWFIPLTPADEDGLFGARALALCDSCPHRAACGAYALAHREQGIWGATTTAQRDRTREARYKADHRAQRREAS